MPTTPCSVTIATPRFPEIIEGSTQILEINIAQEACDKWEDRL